LIDATGLAMHGKVIARAPSGLKCCSLLLGMIEILYKGDNLFIAEGKALPNTVATPSDDFSREGNIRQFYVRIENDEI
jgi:hypothetical protein